MIKKVLTIAGSDAGGGAGIQADLKTFEEYGTFGISTITSILTVSPETKTADIFPIPEDVIAKQLETAYSDGPLDAVKIGLLGSLPVISHLENQFKQIHQPHIILDPVMAVKVNEDILQSELTQQMIKKMFPLVDIITPNLTEAKILSQLPDISDLEQLKEAALNIHSLGPKKVVIKGGARFPGDMAIDLFYDGKTFHFLSGKKIDAQTNHGAGCSFSAAITAGIAKDLSDITAVTLAKEYVRSGIENGVFLNPYTGYIWHGAHQKADKRMNTPLQ